MRYFVDENGTKIDAAYDIDGGDLIFHSRGGSKSSGMAINTAYGPALRLLLGRVITSDVQLHDVLVDTDRTRNLPEDERRIFSSLDSHLEAEELFTRLSRRMARVGQRDGAKGGNQNKRLRFRFTPIPDQTFIVETLGGGNGNAATTDRLQAETLQKVTAHQIWRAAEDIRQTKEFGDFIDSTKFDVLLDDGTRLPPKAVFGRAASAALGFEVKPHHFSGGEGTICFQAIQDAGFQIVAKDVQNKASPAITPPPEDVSWAEGSQRRVTHLKRERRSGLSNAKKRAFTAEHGRLYCERCGIDPVQEYGTHGEACIEVHHTVPVSDMVDGHQTTLDELMCLCADCHRIIHSEMRQDER